MSSVIEMTDSDRVLTASAVFNVIKNNAEKPTLDFRNTEALAHALRDEPFWSIAFSRGWKFVAWFDRDMDFEANTEKSMVDVIMKERATYDWTMGDELCGCVSARFHGSDSNFIIYRGKEVGDSYQFIAIFEDPMNTGHFYLEDYYMAVDMQNKFATWEDVRMFAMDDFGHLFPGEDADKQTLDDWWENLLPRIEDCLLADVKNSMVSVAAACAFQRLFV